MQCFYNSEKKKRKNENNCIGQVKYGRAKQWDIIQRLNIVCDMYFCDMGKCHYTIYVLKNIKHSITKSQIYFLEQAFAEAGLKRNTKY